MSRRLLIIVGTIAVLLVACAPPEAPPGALPLGMREAPVPPVDAKAYVYIRPPGNVTFSSAALGVEDLTLESADVLLADDSSGVAARFSTSGRGVSGPLGELADGWIDADADSFRFGPASPWGVRVRIAWRQQPSDSFAKHFPDVWDDLLQMPGAPPTPPIGAGFVRNFGPLLEHLIGEAGVTVPNLADGLSLVRINRISFVAYADDFQHMPASVGPSVLRDLDVSILAIADSSYPSAVVGQVFDGFVSALGLKPISLGDHTAHHRALSDDISVVVVRDGATLFFAIAATNKQAMALIETVVTQRNER
ncbi:MAG: hypothetical protein O2826_00060 [Chloroflexi bacterium]|nr:hypothetical protein [Chloroflexota bacterium]MDA1172904.1 hypothetical protein [Chloroflexota bacterium]